MTKVKTNFPSFIKKVEQRQYDKLVVATQMIEGVAIKKTSTVFKNSKGNLRGNMYSKVFKRSKELVGRIGNTSVYARIREFGGVIKAILAEYLHFEIDGHWVKVKQVTQNATPYLTPAIEETKTKVLKILAS